MSKDINLKELKKDFEELRKKIEQLEAPLDYQSELDAVLETLGMTVVSAECGGPVLLGAYNGRYVIDLDERGRVKTKGFDSLGYKSIRVLADLCEAVHNSHGC